ncbi:hypothetical protein EVB41_013 [Rhizobium phage RHph_TM3_14A]|nr:hypothetical protein EVB29_013 [Rhizobium phage RHph_TM27A]QIG66933.1 hypothetical protein EVB30_013 [Rhizobium phage RHph_TM27B]QIG67023.1 hypothetical protein EVB31_013 [Rhizobium phage RHph_TM29]QIG67478.1 hypothetical protein EVB41_013 [Rhizobium phage RHph_TM3_14A]
MAYKQQYKNLAPLDNDVQLPAAIRAAAAKADGLHKQVYETAEPAKEDHGQERQQEEPKVTPATEEKKPEPEKTPAPAPNGDEDYQHRYNSLKGRYDKQSETINELTRELGSLRATVDNLRRQPPPAPVERTPENTFKKLTDEEREAYGADFIDVSARAAEEKLMPEIERLRRQVEELGGKVETTAVTVHQTRTMTMNEILDQKLPNWKKINRDPKFLAWANLRDPFSGAIRIDMMRQAHQNGDAERVLNFFNGFLRDEAVVDPAPAKAEVTSEGKVPLETLAAPGRAKAPAASTPPGEKETITRAQIASFYRDVQRGVYRGNEAEKARLEAMIFEAEREGRVV